MKKISVVSYFSGCGGLDLGLLGGFEYMGLRLKKNPFDIKVALDIDSKSVMTYRENIGDHAFVADLSAINCAELPSVDLLIGGFPCQDFSSCGPKLGLKSKRGRLYRTLVDYMQHHRPKLVVAENVPHLARMGDGSVIAKIIHDFEKTGYKFNVWTLYAPDYGVPQTRTRLFFVGVRKDIEGFPDFPEPQFAGKHRSIDWAISDLIPLTNEVPNQEQYFKASPAKRGNGQGDEKNKLGLPSYTIRANAKSRVHFHYALDRRLTVRECARLQTFPDSFIFPHSATANVMQIGNAVPPLLANIVGKKIAEFMTRLDRRGK